MWIEKLTGSLEQKKQWKKDQARLDALPEPYRAAAAAVQRYVLHTGSVVDGETVVAMQNDLADLWERAAADGTPVRHIVGDDPVAFAEEFAAAYSGRRWMDKERERLNRAIDDAAGDHPAAEEDR